MARSSWVLRVASEEGHAAGVVVFARGEGVRHFGSQVAAKLAPVGIHDQADAGWQLSGGVERGLLAKLRAGHETSPVAPGAFGAAWRARQ
ncbi:MAG TPA: hypothetical protein VFN74_16315 [Chloroflexota bacterium]|nr:hypothetical protein [Chloroflexota bacterium]